MEYVAAADCVAVYQGDDGFGHGTHYALELENVEPGHAFVIHVAGMAANVLVATGAKGVDAVLGGRSVTGQEQDADLVIGPGILEGFDHLVDGLGAEGVALLRSIEGDAGHAIRLVIGDVAVLGDRLPVGAIRDRHEKSSLLSIRVLISFLRRRSSRAPSVGTSIIVGPLPWSDARSAWARPARSPS